MELKLMAVDRYDRMNFIMRVTGKKISQTLVWLICR